MLPINGLLEYLGGLSVTQGPLAGQPLQLYPWERRFIRGAFRDGVAEAGLSVARGNGKTALAGGIATAALDGPLNQQRGESVLVASSFEQARIAFGDIKAFLIARYGDLKRADWQIWDSSNKAWIQNRKTLAVVKCLGSDPKRAHGLRPSLCLLDEPAQWPPNTADAMIAALRTSLGKQRGARVLAFGTRAADPMHWFSKLLEGGAEYSQVHAARETDPPFHRRTWQKANPSLRWMPDLEHEIRREARLAKIDPDQLASFKALRLNLGTADVSEQFVIDPGIWQRIEGDAPREGQPVFGVDLGGSASMSSVAAWYPTGRLEAIGAFPHYPTLHDRGQADGVGPLYSRMHQRGELLLLGERLADAAAVVDLAIARFGTPAAIGCDRYRINELYERLAQIGLAHVPVIPRGMGYRDGSEDIRSFREAALTGFVVPVESLLLRAAVREARTISDPAGNEKLSKSTQGGRRKRAKDDALAASILASAIGFREQRRLAAMPPYEFAVVA